MEQIENSKMVDFNLVISVITLNVDSLNQGMAKYFQPQFHFFVHVCHDKGSSWTYWAPRI